MNTNRIVLVLILLAAYPAVGDTLVTKDGRVFEGRVVRQEEDQVVFEVQKYGAYMQVSLESKDVASVKTGASSKPRSSDVYRVPTSQPSTQPSSQPSSQPEATKYYVIEIRGEIGKDVQKESLQLALKDARAKKADCVVFHIDSPGGSVTETEAIVDLMGEVHGQKRIALVAKALSSAAVITMACTDIYMEPGSMIGAAVPYQVGADKNPQVIEEKVFSAIRAMARSAAEMGDHDSLLIQGMMEADLELCLTTTKEGKPLVNSEHQGKVFKERGKILTLTGREAMACGLARGLAEDTLALGKLRGAQNWQDVTGLGRIAMDDRTRKDHDVGLRKEYLRGIAPQLQKIDEDLAKVLSDGKAAEANKAMMLKQYNAEMSTAKSQYDSAMKDAARFPVELSLPMISQAKSTYAYQTSSIQARYQGPAAQVQDTITKLYQEKQRLQEQRAKLMAAAPRPGTSAPAPVTAGLP